MGRLASTGLRPGFLDKFEKRGVKLPSWLANAPTSNGRKAAGREVLT
jgi:hypothetical protein